MDLFIRVEYPDVCSVCGVPFRASEQRIGVLSSLGTSPGPVESLGAVLRADAYHVAHAPPPGTPGRVLGVQEHRRGGVPLYQPEHFASVAETYRAAFAAGSAAPTKAVAQAFSVSRSTAAKWVARAREMGLLGEGVAGRPGV